LFIFAVLINYYSRYRHAGCILELHGYEFLAPKQSVISATDYFILNGISQQAVAYRDTGYKDSKSIARIRRHIRFFCQTRKDTMQIFVSPVFFLQIDTQLKSRGNNMANAPEVLRVCPENTRSDNKVMRLVPKSLILFIHLLQCGRLQSTSLVPAHTFSSGVAIVEFLERILGDVV
jgi:hypothetical protein